MISERDVLPAGEHGLDGSHLTWQADAEIVDIPDEPWKPPED